MDSLDNFRERFAASEQPTEPLQPQPYMGARWRCWGRYPWRGAAVTVLGLALALPHLAQAKTLYCDAGDVKCLIDAIHEANANGETNTIRLQAGTYTLTAVNNRGFSDAAGLPVITSTLTITGYGAETTIIERDTNAPFFRILHVAETGNLTLKRLTLRNGDAGGSACGGITNLGALALIHSIMADHFSVHFGGGLCNFSGTVVITNTTFSNNLADGSSVLFNTGTITVTDSAFTDNLSSGTGFGSIENLGLLVITNSTFAQNAVRSLSGAPAGVAIGNVGTLLLTNSTLADNRLLPSLGGSLSRGGALYSASGATTLLLNTLLARNTGSIEEGTDCFGVVTSLGNNLIGDPTGCTITLHPTTDLTGDPGLGLFTDNGRPGNGHFPLRPTSQAIDAGSDAFYPVRDQLGQRRGNIRGVGASRCDIGAIEFPGKHDRPQDEDDDHHDKDLAAAAQ